jgi:DNA repair ATPase RecN
MLKDMNLEHLLNDYDALTSECRELLEREIVNVRNGSASIGDFDSKKRALIDALEGKLQQLKDVHSRLEGSPDGLRSELNHIQQKFMQLMRLDRDLEKLHLSRDRHPKSVAAPDIARARNMYGRY